MNGKYIIKEDGKEPREIEIKRTDECNVLKFIMILGTWLLIVVLALMFVGDIGNGKGNQTISNILNLIQTSVFITMLVKRRF